MWKIKILAWCTRKIFWSMREEKAEEKVSLSLHFFLIFFCRNPFVFTIKKNTQNKNVRKILKDRTERDFFIFRLQFFYCKFFFSSIRKKIAMHYFIYLFLFSFQTLIFNSFFFLIFNLQFLSASIFIFC